MKAPQCLAAVGTTAAAERLAAAAWYGPPAPAENMEFKAYREKEVQKRLDELFGTKCAYCEFKRAGAPFDIEHYRPKGEVLEDNGARTFPGYWWLASIWSNLLPSCQDCNRARYQDTPEGPYKFGKENKFPLRAGTARATAPGGEAIEQPLLLDPSVDHPGRHLVFRVGVGLGGAETSLVSAVVHADGTIDPKGDATIATVGLDRPSLAVHRMEHIEMLRLALKAAEKEWVRYRRARSPAGRAAALTQFRKDIRAVALRFFSWRAPYSAACKAEYRAWLASIRGI